MKKEIEKSQTSDFRTTSVEIIAVIGAIQALDKARKATPRHQPVYEAALAKYQSQLRSLIASLPAPEADWEIDAMRALEAWRYGFVVDGQVA